MALSTANRLRYCCMWLQSEGDGSNLIVASANVQDRIKLIVLGNPVLLKTVQDVDAMPFTEFATVFAVSMKISDIMYRDPPLP